MFVVLHEIDIVIFQNENGAEPFNQWLNSQGVNTKKHIFYELTKMKLGHFGDHEYLGDGVSEFKFSFDHSYRMYFAGDGEKIIILLCGTTSQRTSNMRNAKNYWRQYVEKNFKKI